MRCTKCSCTVNRDSEKKDRVNEWGAHIENGKKNPEEKHNTEASVGCSPPREGKRGADVGGYLTPVEGEETHTQAMRDTKQVIDLDILGRDPADP
jgi:hypothetical protein